MSNKVTEKPPLPYDPARRPKSVFTRVQARRLTDRIAKMAEETWRLLREAHDGNAWAALGYADWKQYVRTEFGMGDRNARYLLDQANVISELEVAAGVALSSANVSQRAAQAVKADLPAVAADVRKAVKGKHRERRPAIVHDAVERKRASALRTRSSSGEGAGGTQIACPRCNGSGWIDAPKGRGAEVKAADCKHPVSRRIGKNCAMCGAAV